MIEESFTIPGAGGGTFDITVYPAPADGKNYPMLLVLHGNVGLNAEYGPRIQRFAKRLSELGYLTAVPRYYVNNIGDKYDEAPGPKVDILAAAIKHVADLDGADESRMGLIGYSLGAAIAMHYIGIEPAGRVQVLVDFFGPVKPFASVAPIPPPISTGIGKFPPTITFHDAKDMIVPAERSKDLHDLFPTTIDHELHIYSAEPPIEPNHVFKEGGAADTDSLRRAEDWVVKYMPPTGV